MTDTCDPIFPNKSEETYTSSGTKIAVFVEAVGSIIVIDLSIIPALLPPFIRVPELTFVVV